MRCLLCWLLIALFLTGCSPQVGLPVTTGPSSTPIPVVTMTAVETETPAAVTNCAFAWSERGLPEVTDKVNQAFLDAGFREVSAEARAYGEDCIDPQTNEVVQFSAMQTDFHISIAITDTSSKQVLGDWVERVMRVLEPYKPGKVAGPNPGYVGITFGTSSDTVNLWFPRTQAEELIKDGTRGSHLFEALQDQSP